VNIEHDEYAPIADVGGIDASRVLDEVLGGAIW
jgi:hypothetical protein